MIYSQGHLSTILSIILLSGCTISRIPPQTAEEMQVPRAEPSIIKVEGRVDLPSIERLANETILPSYSDSGDQADSCKIEVPVLGEVRLGDVSYRLNIGRSHLKVFGRNGRLVIGGTFSVWATATCIVKIFGTEVARVSETTDEEGLLDLELSGEFSVSPLYKVQARITESHNWTRAPKFNVLWDLVPITIQTKADDAIKRAIPGAIQSLENNFAKIDFLHQSTTMWNGLHEPLQVNGEPPLWVSSRPLSLHVSQLSTDDSYARVSAALRSVLKLLSGGKPEDSDLVALPILSNQVPVGNLHIYIPVDLPYEHIERLLKEQLGNKPIKVPQGTFKFYDFDLYQSGDKLVFGIRFSARPNWFIPISGFLYISGIPQVDSSTNTVKLIAVQYEPHFYNPIFYLIDWIFKDQFRKALEEAAQFDLSTEINQLKKKINDLPPKQVSKEITVTGKVTEITLVYLIPNRNRISLGIGGEGHILIDVTLSLP